MLNRLANDLRVHLNEMSRRLDHRPLAEALINPPLQAVTVDTQLILRRQTVQGKWLAIAFRVRETRVAFVTEYPDLWFVVPAGQRLEDRVAEVLTAEATRREKEGLALPEGLVGRAWVTPMTINITAGQQLPKERLDFAAMFSASRIGSGAEELHRVGRSVDELYPDGLDHACLRESEVTELTHLLQREDRGHHTTPVVLRTRAPGIQFAPPSPVQLMGEAPWSNQPLNTYTPRPTAWPPLPTGAGTACDTKSCSAPRRLSGPDQQVLLIRNTYRNTYGFPGGYLSTSEAPVSAAQRELKEEVGIWCSRSQLRLAFVNEYAEGRVRGKDWIFETDLESAPVLTLDLREIESAAFFDLARALELPLEQHVRALSASRSYEPTHNAMPGCSMTHHFDNQSGEVFCDLRAGFASNNGANQATEQVF